MKNTIRLASIMCVLFSAQITYAQPGKDLPTESVDVVKDFEARLLETNRIPLTPLLPALDTSTKAQTYIIQPKPIAMTYPAPSLRPIGMKKAGKEKIYNGWLKAGAGVPVSFYGEGGYFFSQKDKYDAKLWAKHHSANFKSLENQRFMKNGLGANVNYYINDNTALESQLSYRYDRVHFFGYDHDSLEFSPEAVRQDYKMPEISFRLFNSERNTTDLNYSINPKIYVLSDYYSNKETGFDLTMSATKWFAQKHPFRMVVRTDFSKFRDTATQNLNNIYLQPSFTYHADFLKFKVGGNFASNRDVFTAFPDLEATLRIWGDGVQLFAGWNGDLKKNNFRTITTYNPYIDIRGSKLKNTKWNNYYGGLKGNLGWLEYSVQGGYSNAKDLALYQTKFLTTGITRFQVLYDTVDIFNLQGSIKVNPTKELTLSGTLSQSVFDPKNQSNAWGLPGLEGNFSGRYALLGGKAAVKAECYIADKIKRRAVDGLPGKDGALIDLSIGGTYNFAENIGIFLDINNIMNNKRERWHNYPTYGLNVLGGVQVKF